jgi:hypothetical protein
LALRQRTQTWRPLLFPRRQPRRATATEHPDQAGRGSAAPGHRRARRRAWIRVPVRPRPPPPPRAGSASRSLSAVSHHAGHARSRSSR